MEGSQTGEAQREGTTVNVTNHIHEGLENATFNELGNRMLELAEQARKETQGNVNAGAEGRDLSLAITHLEDALTRWNSSRYRRQGIWQRRDPDLVEA